MFQRLKEKGWIQGVYTVDCRLMCIHIGMHGYNMVCVLYYPTSRSLADFMREMEFDAWLAMLEHLFSSLLDHLKTVQVYTYSCFAIVYIIHTYMHTTYYVHLSIRRVSDDVISIISCGRVV